MFQPPPRRGDGFSSASCGLRLAPLFFFFILFSRPSLAPLSPNGYHHPSFRYFDTLRAPHYRLLFFDRIPQRFFFPAHTVFFCSWILEKSFFLAALQEVKKLHGRSSFFADPCGRWLLFVAALPSFFTRILFFS